MRTLLKAMILYKVIYKISFTTIDETRESIHADAGEF
jgi:hypothetical protein